MNAKLSVGLVALLASATARAATHAPSPSPSPSPSLDQTLPGEKEFVACRKYPETKKFRWTVRGEVGVAELVASLGEIACQAILVGPGAVQRAGKVTLEVPDLLTAPEVYRLFYSSLEVLGLTVERSGSTLKIVDAGRAKEVSTPLYGSEPTPIGDQFVTRLIRLEHARPQELADLLGRLRSKEGEVTVYASGSSLVVTDRGSVVRRMEELARVLDVPRAGERLWSIGTHAQSASELASTVEKILQASRRSEGGGDPKAQAAPAGGLGEGVTAVVPVDGARLLVVVASEDGYRRVLGLAAKIDPPLPEDGGGQGHVIYLANTNAEDLAQTLQSIGLSSRTATTPRPQGQSSASPLGGSGALGLQGEVRVGADKVSNAIVVFASSGDFQMVRDLITKLDVPRRQVYVEVRILDISVDKSRALGLVFHGTDSLAGGAATGIVASSAPGLNTVSLNSTSLASALGGGGLLAGVIGQQLNVAGFSLPSVGVLLQALEHSKDVSVISRPHLLTMDNAKATLTVGQTFPYLASSLGSAAGGSTIIGTYNRADVQLKLDLTPHLNESDSVRLELDGEISDVPDGAALNNPGGPITNKRTIKTAIVIRDGETVVLGGLQKDSESESIDKIPFLGDIPVLGRLFQYRSKQRTKSDLLIVITPYVIRGPEDLRHIYDRKAAEEREFAERYAAFHDQAAFEIHVDYRRKRGLLQEINLIAIDAERDAVALRKAERSLKKRVLDEEIR